MATAFAPPAAAAPGNAVLDDREAASILLSVAPPTAAHGAPAPPPVPPAAAAASSAVNGVSVGGVAHGSVAASTTITPAPSSSFGPMRQPRRARAWSLESLGEWWSGGWGAAVVGRAGFHTCGVPVCLCVCLCV